MRKRQNLPEEIACYILVFYAILNQATVLPQLFRDWLNLASTNLIGFGVGTCLVPILLKRIVTYRQGIVPIFGLKFWLITLGAFFAVETVDAVVSGYGIKFIAIILFNISVIVICVLNSSIRNQDFNAAFNEISRPLRFFSYYVAFSGIAAFLLVELEWVDIAEWQTINLYMKKGKEGAGGALYSMPYYLSLVLTGDSVFYFLGIDFHRISGLSIEPQIASYLAVPVLFERVSSNSRKRLRTKAICLILIAYLFLCASLTTLLGLTVVAATYSWSFFTKLKRNKATAVVLLIASLAMLLLSLSNPRSIIVQIIPRIENPSGILAVESIFLPIIESSNLFDYGLFAVHDGAPQEFVNLNRGALGLLVGWIVLGVLARLAIKLLRADSSKRLFALLPLYLAFHWLKSPAHYAYFPVTYLFLLLWWLWSQKLKQELV